MSQTVIDVKNVGKKYKLGERQPYLALRDFLSYPIKTIRNKMKRQEEVWALSDIDFSVKKGEVVGIIGRNGAGKSTILKIFSRITPPTTGEIQIDGRIGSLLEVGTGFNPELTGRENIYLNGAILGMRKKEIEDKFDDIVEFSGIKKFLDTPVKRYSSGMYVRLAFSVAAHLDPEILLVDEVLAVGDAEFQKKCIGKMSEVTKTEGRTILFVSHNMGAVEKLCDRVIVLDKGKVVFDGDTKEGISTYLNTGSADGKLNPRAFWGGLEKKIKFKTLTVNNKAQGTIHISPQEDILLTATAEAIDQINPFKTTLSVYQGDTRILSMHDSLKYESLEKGIFTVTCTIPAYTLRPGAYSVALGGHTDGMHEFLFATHLMNFTVREEWDDHNMQIDTGIINIPFDGSREYKK